MRNKINEALGLLLLNVALFVLACVMLVGSFYLAEEVYNLHQSVKKAIEAIDESNKQ